MENIGRKKLILLSSGNMNALNGSAKFVKLFYDNISFFEKNNVEMKVYSNSNGFANEVQYRKTFTFAIRHFLNKLALHSKILNILKFKRSLKQGELPIKDMCIKEKETNGIVILNDFFIAYNYFCQFGKENKTMVMLHNNGDMLSMIGKGLPKFFEKKLYSMQKIILELADEFICVSEPSKQLFMEQNPSIKNRVKYIPIGQMSLVEKESYSIDKLHLVTVGTICRRKNQIAILHALHRIPNKNIQLTIVGSGPMKEECEKYVIKNKMEHQVELVGAQSEVIPFLEQANVFIMSSLDEGLPISAQEAMNVGLPLIMTDVGGCKELIDGNGILVKENQLEELIKAIQWFDQNKEKIKQLGTRSKQVFEKKYTQKIMLNNYLNHINEID